MKASRVLFRVRVAGYINIYGTHWPLVREVRSKSFEHAARAALSRLPKHRGLRVSTVERVEP